MIDSLLKDPLFSKTEPYRTFQDKPLGFIDIGARGGVHELVEPLAAATAVLGFEPDQEECARMRQALALSSPWANCQMEASALAEGDGEAVLHLLSAPTNHSLRPPNRKLTDRYKMVKWQLVGTQPLRTTGLDKILFGSRAAETHWGEFIKLDTQGTEFEIMQGARRTLSERTVALVTEVAFVQTYEGQKLFSEIEIYLRELGFSFYGFASQHHRSCKLLDKRKEAGRERLLFGDAVFFKDPLPIGLQVPELSPRAIHALFVCAILLGYPDFALELALKTWAKGDEAARIEGLIHHLAAAPPAESQQDAAELARRVLARPDFANIEVGRFVDRRRLRCDYDDFLEP